MEFWNSKQLFDVPNHLLEIVKDPVIALYDWNNLVATTWLTINTSQFSRECMQYPETVADSLVLTVLHITQNLSFMNSFFACFKNSPLLSSRVEVL